VTFEIFGVPGAVVVGVKNGGVGFCFCLLSSWNASSSSDTSVDPSDAKVRAGDAVFTGLAAGAVTHLFDLGMYFHILPSPGHLVGLSGIFNGPMMRKSPTHTDFNDDGGGGAPGSGEEESVMVRKLVNYILVFNQRVNK